MMAKLIDISNLFIQYCLLHSKSVSIKIQNSNYSPKTKVSNSWRNGSRKGTGSRVPISFSDIMQSAFIFCPKVILWKDWL
jgi:hypothetical protein